MFERSWSDGISERSASLSAFVEQPDRRLDAVQLVARDTEPEEDVGTLDVGERRAFGERSGALEQRDRLANFAGAHAHGRLAGKRTRLELGQAGRQHGGADLLELLESLVVSTRLEQGVGAGKRGVDPAALVRGDAVREEACVDTEPLREPDDRLGGRTGLPALDLADVLLREAVAGEVGLGQRRRRHEAGVGARRAEARPERRRLAAAADEWRSSQTRAA